MSTVLPLERRNHPRYATSAETRIVRTNAIPIETVTGDIVQVAPQGVRMNVAVPLIAGERLELQITDAPGGPILVTAEVQWIDRSDDGNWLVGCGLGYELSRTQLADLRGLIEPSR